MKTPLVFLGVILFNVLAYGQHHVGIKILGGLSYISTKVFQSPPQTTQTFYFMPSGQGGLFYNLHLGKKSLLGVELLYTLIEGKEHSVTPETYNMNGTLVNSPIINDITRHISYLSIPVYYGLKYKKLNINLGIQSNFALSSGGSAVTTAFGLPAGVVNTNYIKLGALPIKAFDFGPKIGLSFSVRDWFAFEATYYYGLLNIYKNNHADFQYKVQQLTIGLRYTLLILKKKEQGK
ncbi:MAG: outer membrane beta-barrel protein [Bacteroidia bacterium]